MECLPREILTADFFWMHTERHVAQFIAGETLETGVGRIQISADLSMGGQDPEAYFFAGILQ
jgi:hypothetical protein